MAACSCALVILASDPIRAANAANVSSDKTANLALYYGADLPIDELRAFDIVVVEPDHKINARAPTGAHTKFFAYVSVGEVLPSRDYYKRVDPTWKVGENRAWGSIVIDQSRPEWHRFFVEEVVRPLWQRGYRGLFLDTMDSYYLLADRDHPWARQVEGTAALIRAVRASFPGIELVFNRGFEIVPLVREHVHTVVAESLIRGWNAEEKRYFETAEKDHTETLAELVKIRDELKLPVVVIDYVPAADRKLARETADRIRVLGFKPYITTPDLDMVGLGDIEVHPRKVLLVYDKRDVPDLHLHPAQRFAVMPLNYLGYTVEFVDLKSELPSTPLPGRYAGIITWFDTNEAGEDSGYRAWLVNQLKDGMRVAVFEHFGVPLDAELAALLGVQPAKRSTSNRLRVVHRAPMIGFEMAPLVDSVVLQPLRLADGPESESLLRLGNSSGEHFDTVGLTRSGGFALTPYSVRELPPLNYTRWIVEPLEFMQRTLALQPFPVPDVTTENGSRLMLVHIDGDGFPSRAEVPGTPLGGEMLLTEVLSRYKVPTTVSIIQGEIAPDGMYKALSPALEAAAKRIFALPYVEAASHSYSHPFVWRKVGTDAAQGDAQSYHLEIPGYKFDLNREIAGSLDYINRRLLPPGKRAQVFLWTGDCVVTPEALRAAYEAGVANMNGGDTVITRSRNTLTLIAPLGIKKGGLLQVFAPNQNENVYTANWTGPFYGFERVLETFELTETPRRFKPINIYYHTYAVTKPASIVALHKIYQYALSQRVFNIYGSEYVRKVQDFFSLVIARDRVRDGWLIRGKGELRTLRLPADAVGPDLLASRGLAGHASGPSARYLHLTGAEAFIKEFKDSKDAPADAARKIPVHLVQANGRITQWQRQGDVVSASFDSHVPLTLEFAAATGCELQHNRRTLKPVATDGNRQRYVLAESGPQSVTLRCP